MNPPDSEFKSLAEFLRRRREIITRAWLHAVQTSPDFSTPDRLPVPQLIDHLPALLDDLGGCINGEDEVEAATPNARAHGKSRWEQHFRLDELLRELLLLRRIVTREIESFQADRDPSVPKKLERQIRERVEHFFEEAIVRSTDQFYAQHQAQIEKDRCLLASLHEAARDSADQHQAVASARLRLLRVIAHELRNLLNAARLTATSLPGEQDPAWRDELQQMLERNLRQMTALVNQLLDVAPLLSGREPLELAPLDLHKFALEQRRMFEEMAARKGLLFDIHIAPDLNDIVTDEAKLQRIVMNLIQNAIKYTDAGGVSVDLAHAEDKGLAVRVTDTGRGIPSEHQTKIFDEFHRVPGTQDQEGTGLGLAIVRELIGQLDGEIHVESYDGKGASFHIRLPKKAV